MKQLDKIVAEKLLGISAIKLQPELPFTWASGWNSPIYTDNRKTLSYPELRSFIKVELCRLILERFEIGNHLNLWCYHVYKCIITDGRSSVKRIRYG